MFSIQNKSYYITYYHSMQNFNNSNMHVVGLMRVFGEGMLLMQLYYREIYNVVRM